MLTLPVGEDQERRDKKLRGAMSCGEWDHMDEKTFKEMWGDELDLFAYDASEKVEDWWTKWGPLLVREGPNRRSMVPNVQVSISKDG
jgi:salicylate hydroxylase